MKKKLQSQSGVSFTELLTVVLIISLLTSVVGGGVVVVRNAYYNITRKAEAQTLLSTTITAITDDLRFAQDIKTDTDGKVDFYSGNRKYRMKYINKKDDNVGIDKKGIYIEAMNGSQIPLLTTKTKTNNLVSYLEDDMTYTGGIFHFTVVVERENQTLAKQEITVRPINS